MKFHWGHGILSFLILFLTLCTIFIVFSLRQHNDLVSEDYYQQGADYTHQIESNLRSAIFIDSLTIIQNENGLALAMSPGLSNQANRFEIYFFRPSDKREDFRTEWKDPLHVMVFDPSHLIQGRYQLKLFWMHENKTYMIEKEVYIK